jgi:hypothetical protein
MAKKQQKKKAYDIKCVVNNAGGCSSGGAVYGLGFIGALIYYVTAATTTWGIIVGIFKALFWPAFLVYSAMKYLGL